MARAMSSKQAGRGIAGRWGGEEGVTYLQGGRDALGDQQAAVRGALAVVFHHHVVRVPDPVGLLRRALCAQRRAAVPRQGGEDDAVLQADLAVGYGQGLEELGVVPLWDRHFVGGLGVPSGALLGFIDVDRSGKGRWLCAVFEINVGLLDSFDIVVGLGV